MSRALRPRSLAIRTGSALVVTGACAVLVAGQLAIVSTASAAAPPAPAAVVIDLGTAATYSVLAGAGVSNTGTATVLDGNLGLSPAGVIAGFPPGTTKATIHDKDADAELAQSDRQEAYDDVVALESTDTFAGDQAGQTYTSGVYTSAAAITNTGTMTLDAAGDPSAVFVFQIGAAFSPAAQSKIVLKGGALANNVYWQVAGAVSFGAGAKAVGTFLGAGAIAFGEAASVKGRLLTPSTVALANTPVTEPVDDFVAPVVTISGGAARSTKDTTPAIAGTTDEPAGTDVTVTVGGQTLTTEVGAAGHWNVSAAALTEGRHTVEASASDASHNIGSDSQVLTVDLTAPVVRINGRPAAATNDTTPLITGRTNAPATSHVAVTVGGQHLSSPIAADGTWGVEAAALNERSYGVTATVVDRAQNKGTANQILTVDLTKPVVSINGGSTRSTDDTSPWIYGKSAEQAGTTVHVTIGDQAMTATVHAGGAWGVSATTLPVGVHHVRARITDAARNTGIAKQDLTITGHGEPETRYQPDAAIRTVPGRFIGGGIYDVSDQQVTKQLRGKARIATFQIRVTNRGDAAERMHVRGTPKNRKFTVNYLAGGTDVTRVVTGGTYLTKRLAPGDQAHLVLKVTRTKRAVSGDTRSLQVRAVSSHTDTARDTVGAVVRVGGGTQSP